MDPFPSRRLEVELDDASASEIEGMSSIFQNCLYTEKPKLEQAMYAGHYEDAMVQDILREQLHSEYSKFQVAFDVAEDIVPDPAFDWGDEDLSYFDERMSYGWVAVGVVPRGGSLSSYEASDLYVYTSFRMLAQQARLRGEDARRLNTNEPRYRLAVELSSRSSDGQNRCIHDPHLVVNSLTLWPNNHSDSTWEMALKLLRWAVRYAERHDWPIWAQTLVDQAQYFREAGFREVRRFTLNLNHYAPPRSTDLGSQEWVQMVYEDSRERRARSSSPEARGGRQRRPSL